MSAKSFVLLFRLYSICFVKSKFININIGDSINYNEIISEEKYKKPPPRFTESSIIKTLEHKQIGRPSTYANIISNIFDKKYVEKKIIKSLIDSKNT